MPLRCRHERHAAAADSAIAIIAAATRQPARYAGCVIFMLPAICCHDAAPPPLFATYATPLFRAMLIR